MTGDRTGSETGVRMGGGASVQATAGAEEHRRWGGVGQGRTVSKAGGIFS